MAELLPDTVKRMTEHGEEEIPLQDVQEGDRLIVRSGDISPVPVTEISIIPLPLTAPPITESPMFFSTVFDSPVTTGTGENSYLSKVMEMVKQAQSEKSKLESISDRVAKWLFYIALFVGVLAFIGWLLVTKDLSLAFERISNAFRFFKSKPFLAAMEVLLAITKGIAKPNAWGILYCLIRRCVSIYRLVTRNERFVSSI
jgi:Cu2+-exporting ATPase